MGNTLHADKRFHIAKGDNKRLRKSGKIPAILYGLKESSMLVEFAELDVYDVIKRVGEHGVIDIELDGKSEKSLIKEVQRDPVTKKIIHIDLQRVRENEKIKTKVPVIVKGEDTLKNYDAIAQIEKDEIEIECIPSKIPNCIAVDVSYRHPNERIRIKDIEIANEISVLDDLNSVIVSVKHIKDHTSQTETPQVIEVVYQEDMTP